MSQWKPGQSGNPSGRPKKGKALTDILRELGQTPRGKGKSRAELLAVALWTKALAGDMTAIKYIFDRLDGIPVPAELQDTPTDNRIEIILVDEMDSP